MEIPKIGGKKPIAVELQKGKEYYFRTCGASHAQPWCNGSHQSTPFKPMAFTTEDFQSVVAITFPAV